MSPGYIYPQGGGGGTSVPASGNVLSGAVNAQFALLSGTMSRFNLSSGIVSSGHLADASVVSGSVSSGSVSRFHIADGGVTSGNYASGQIGAVHFSSGLGVPLGYAKIEDQKAVNTAGGTFTQAAWAQRDLNTEVVDTGGFASVAGNQITLDPGVYRIRATAPGYNVLRHKAKLWHATSGDIVVGTSEYANANMTRSLVEGRFTVPVAMTFQIRHICSQTQITDGFGVQGNFSGQIEIYTTVELWREGP